MEKVAGTTGTNAAGGQPLELPASVPQIEDDVVDAALEKSAKARRLHRRLCEREAEGKPLSAKEVEKVVKSATGPDGQPDGAQAVVLAAHAQKNPECFGGGHSWLLRFLERIEWVVLIGDLRNFIAGLRAQTEEERKRDELKKSLEQDRLELDVRRATLVRMDRARGADARGPVDAELEAQNRLRLTMERMRRT
jgi:hypothetical protein